MTETSVATAEVAGGQAQEKEYLGVGDYRIEVQSGGNTITVDADGNFITTSSSGQVDKVVLDAEQKKRFATWMLVNESLLYGLKNRVDTDSTSTTTLSISDGFQKKVINHSPGRYSAETDAVIAELNELLDGVMDGEVQARSNLTP